ncbi:disulfide bond formation protein D [Mycobacteroides abscessus]|nr:disulfide bond formation protein D [Mycobacteroides abscessus]
MRRSENGKRDIWIAGILGVVIVALATYLLVDTAVKAPHRPTRPRSPATTAAWLGYTLMTRWHLDQSMRRSY